MSWAEVGDRDSWMLSLCSPGWQPLPWRDPTGKNQGHLYRWHKFPWNKVHTLPMPQGAACCPLRGPPAPAPQAQRCPVEEPTHAQSLCSASKTQPMRKLTPTTALQCPRCFQLQRWKGRGWKGKVKPLDSGRAERDQPHFPLSQESGKCFLITHRLNDLLAWSYVEETALRVFINQGSPEKQNQQSVSVYNVKSYYQELAHTIMEADKSQYLQGEYSFTPKAGSLPI